MFTDDGNDVDVDRPVVTELVEFFGHVLQLGAQRTERSAGERNGAFASNSISRAELQQIGRRFRLGHFVDDVQMSIGQNAMNFRLNEFDPEEKLIDVAIFRPFVVFRRRLFGKRLVPIVTELGDAVANVVQRAMQLTGFHRRVVEDGEIESTNQLAHRTAVDDRRVQHGVQTRHVLLQKVSIDVDGIPGENQPLFVRAHRRDLLDEIHHGRFSIGHAQRTVQDLLNETRTGVMFRAPRAHRVQQRLRMVNDQIGTFMNFGQIEIRHDTGDLQDEILLQIQSVHFQVDPYQCVPGDRHARTEV